MIAVALVIVTSLLSSSSSPSVDIGLARLLSAMAGVLILAVVQEKLEGDVALLLCCAFPMVGGTMADADAAADSTVLSPR